MKFNKISRKVLAYACATAMVFSSVSAYQVLQVSAYEESDYTTIGDDKTVTVGDWTLYAGNGDQIQEKWLMQEVQLTT